MLANSKSYEMAIETVYQTQQLIALNTTNFFAIVDFCSSYLWDSKDYED